MLRLSKRADYALIAMRHLALNADRGWASAREIAEAYNVPVELLAKVLQRLVRGELLSSHQGINGGYELARPAAAISVADVIAAIDGPLRMTACSEADESCDQYARCNIRDPLWRIKDRIVEALSTCSIQEMAAESLASPAVPVAPVTLAHRSAADLTGGGRER
jgi:Rrf2 family protein